MTHSQTFAQSDSQQDLLVVLKSDQVIIQKHTAEECLRWYFASSVALDSYNLAVENGRKRVLKTKITYFLYGLGSGAILSLTYILARKQ